MRNRQAPDLFGRLPGHYRMRDAAEGRPLQALMALLGEEMALVEADLDQLYDNWFIETAEPWALPYIAALVGATPMREIGTDQGGLMRAYIANVLQYRQAKGTAAVVEQVARDVSGWSVVAVEFFQHLATSQHMRNLRPAAVVFPDVHNSGRVRHSRSPFADMDHGAAAGMPAGYSGRYNIPHLGLFVWRQGAAPLWPVADAGAYTGGPLPVAEPGAPGLMRFDPLGRDLPLVNRPAADMSAAARMTARTTPVALTRAELRAAFDAARAGNATPGDWFEDNPPLKIRLDGADVARQDLFACDLSRTEGGDYRRPKAQGQVLVDPQRGLLCLHPDDEALPVETGFAQPAGHDIGAGPQDRRDSMATWLPGFVIRGEDDPFHIGVSKVTGDASTDTDQGGIVVANLRDAIGRWNAHAQASPGARGIITVMDSATYDENLTAARRIILPPGSKLAIVAAAWPGDERGATFVRDVGRFSPLYRRPYLTGAITLDALEAGNEEGGSLVLDGLAIAQGLTLRAGRDLHRLDLYNCTIGAGAGQLAGGGIVCANGNARASVSLHRSILSRLVLRGPTGALTLSRSILGEDRTADGAPPAGLLIDAADMDAEISGSTLLGRASLRSIEAENSLLCAPITLQHRQQGCVRFCYAAPGSALPRRHACVPLKDDPSGIRPNFASTRFADAGFARLAQSTPSEIAQGAEDGMEMGAGFASRDPARLANLRDAIAEFAPFGLIPGIIFVN